MTIHFFCALLCEANPIIENYNLIKSDKYNLFNIYLSADKEITLTLTGIGKSNMAKAVNYHHECVNTSSNNIWLNIGIAGHKNIEIGEIRLVNKITDDEDKLSWYPQIIFDPPCDCLDLVSLKSPSTKYKSCLYDMEASGFYQMAVKFGTSELIHSLKIISDNSKKTISEINKKNIEFIVKNKINVIEKLLAELEVLTNHVTPKNRKPKYYNLFLKKWHFTQSEKHILSSLLTKLLIRYKNENFFEMTEHLTTGKLVLKELQNKINNINFSIN